MAIEVLELQVRTTGTQQSANQFESLGRSVSGVRSALGFLRNALVIFSAVRAFSGIVGLVDSFTELTTKLKLVTSNTDELTAVTQKLFEVSQETRTSFESNVTLFNRVARATTGLHLNFNQLIDSTRTVAQLIKISGATSAEASGAMIQFSQALASNRLSGDELRTVLEQLPRLADVIGKEFGVSGAALRGLANSNPGIITTERIMRAIANAASTTNDEFKKTIPTISDGFILVGNALTLFIGRLNQAGGVGAFLFETLAKIAQNIDLIVVALLALAALGTFNLIASQALAFATNIGRAGGVLLGLINFLTFSVGTLIRAFAVLTIGVVNLFAGRAISGGSVIVTTLTAIGNAAKTAAIAVGTFVLQMVRVGAVSAVGAIGALRGVFAAVTTSIATASFALTGFLLRMSLVVALAVANPMRTLAAGFTFLAQSILGAAAAMGRLALAVLANPLFLGAAIVIGVIVGLFFLFRKSVEDLIDSFGGLRGIVNNVFAFIQTGVVLLFTRFDLLWKAIQEGAFNAFQAIKSVFFGFLDAVSSGIKTISFGQIDLGQFNFEPVKSQFDGAGKELSETFSKNFQENLNADPLKKLEEGAKGTVDFLHGLLTGGNINENALLGKPPGGQFGSPQPNNDKAQKKIESLTQQIETFIARVDPFFDINAKIDKMKNLFKEAGKAGVDLAGILARAGLTQEEVFKRIEREELGVGNATSFYKEKVLLLEDAVARHIITENEFTEALRLNRIEFLSFQRDIASGVELAVQKLDDEAAHHEKTAEAAVTAARASSQALRLFADTQTALNLAKQQGVITEEQYIVALRAERDAVLELQRDSQSGITLALDAIQDKLTNEKEIAKQVVTDALAQETAFKTLAVQTKVLDDAVKAGAISNEQYAKTLRDLKIAALDAQTDTASGFERGLLKAQRDLSDTAKLSEKVITDMFSGLTDTLVEFFKTGKLNFKDLIDTITTDLLKLAVTQSITAPLAGLLGLGGGTGGGGGLFGGGSNAGISPTGGGSAFGGIGSFLFGSGGATSGLGGLFGFANEGSFQVGGTGGTDSQLVAFRASPDEHVTIEKPGNRRAQSDQNVRVEMHFHGATDMDGFRRAEDQIATRAGQKVNRALARNG